MFALVLCVFFVLCSAALGLAMKIVRDHEATHKRLAYPYTQRTVPSASGLSVHSSAAKKVHPGA